MRRRVYNLDIFDIKVVVDGNGIGTIASRLRESCPHCSSLLCDLTCGTEEPLLETQDRLQWNIYMNIIESVILAHGCSGVDIASPEYTKGIETSIDSIQENFF